MSSDATPPRTGHDEPDGARELELTGWGRVARSRTRATRPETLAALAACVSGADTALPRGLGRSYGDAALNSAGHTLLLERLNRLLAFDPESGVLDVEPGVSLHDVLDTFVPRGYFPMVTPGTRSVTVGGCVASDVHGKNHHVDGSFSRHTLELDVLLASGETVTCSREHDPELFWATTGGMGLTGCLTRVRLQMQRIETAWMTVTFERTTSIASTMSRLRDTDTRYRYSVAWLDAAARSRNLGRGILMQGEHASVDALSATQQHRPLERRARPTLGIPFERVPGALLNRAGIRAFNALYYHRHALRGDGNRVRIDPYFYPLDAITNWNRLYGREGFVQYQCLLPDDECESGFPAILSAVSTNGPGSYLAVLKRMGPGEPGQLIAFPGEGFTLALDIPWRGSGALELLQRLDRIVLQHGGRIYLAKDAHLDAASFREMYPEHERWLDIKRRVDPNNRFSSDLARRLGLLPGVAP